MKTCLLCKFGGNVFSEERKERAINLNDSYLCKAKRIVDGEWIKGYLYRLSERLNPFIMLVNSKGESYEVDSSTVCRCMRIGEKPVGEHEIYQWVDSAYGKITGIIKFGEYAQDGSGGEYPSISCYGFYAEVIKIYPCEWDEQTTQEELEELYPDYLRKISVPKIFTDNSISDVKLLGNIFDNPELLEVIYDRE